LLSVLRLYLTNIEDQSTFLRGVNIIIESRENNKKGKERKGKERNYNNIIHIV